MSVCIFNENSGFAQSEAFWGKNLQKYKNVKEKFIWFPKILGNEKRSKGKKNGF